MKVVFEIENVTDAVPSFPTRTTFTQRGGLIGSGEDATWRIQSLHDELGSTVARVVVVDGHFTIEAVSQTPIRINGAKAPLPRGRVVILSDKDNVAFADLSCVVKIVSGLGVEELSMAHDVSAEFSDQSSGKESLILEGNVAHVEKPRAAAQTVILDPLEQMDKHMDKKIPNDPLDAFGPTAKQGADILEEQDGELLVEEAVATAPDHSDTHFASMPNVRVKTDKYGFEEEGEATKVHPSAATLELEGPVDHVALRPLAKRLGVQLGDLSTHEANRTLADIGASLRAAVDGLNRIYKSRPKGEGNFPIAKMHMHALEDNPLRFAEDTDTALHALFSKRGPVYLSAPAAVAESMDHLHAHQKATEGSVDVALDTVMRALRPKALERRFATYNQEEIPEDRDAYDAWCWRMYRAYYSELQSQRQKGLQMLFWEVFEHEYNALMRRYQFGGDDQMDE